MIGDWWSVGSSRLPCALLTPRIQENFRIGTSEGTKSQRLHEVSLDDRYRVKAFASRGWGKLQDGPE